MANTRMSENMDIFNCLPEMAVIIDSQKRFIVAANPVFFKKTGLSKNNVIGKKCHEIFLKKNTPCKKDGQYCLLSKVLKTRSVININHPYFDKKGDPGYLNITASSMKNRSPQKNLILAVLRPSFKKEKIKVKPNISRVKKPVHKDPLTGIYNYYYFIERLTAEIYRSQRYGYPLSLAKMDIEYFESINTAYGRKTGDKLLIEMAGFLKGMLRKSDILARYGGEEFIILMAQTDKIGAEQAAYRLMNKINTKIFKISGLSIKIKTSFGISTLSADTSCDDRDKMLNAVEKALVRAKNIGGNKVISFSELYSDKQKEEKNKKKEGVVFLKRRIKKLSERVDRITLDSISAFSKSLEARDNYTGAHAEKTIDIARKLGEAVGLNEETLDILEKGAMLHDIGKIGISDAILRKKSKLTAEEFRMIKSHPKIGAEIIRVIHFLRDVVPVVLYHHERWDGKGYPSGLKGEEIPITARIVAIADAYQALTSDRPYRKAFTKKQAMEILKKEAGKHFDRDLVDLLIKLETKQKNSAYKIKRNKSK